MPPSWAPSSRPCLLKVQSKSTSNVSRNGASAAALLPMFQCFNTLIVNNFFLVSSLNLPSFSYRRLPLVLLLRGLLRSLTPPFLQAPFRYWKATIQSLWSLLFSIWPPPSLSACLCRRGAPSLWSSLWPSWGLTPACPCPSCAGGPRHGCSTWWGVSPEQRGSTVSLTLLPTLLLMQHRVFLAFWAPAAHCWVILISIEKKCGFRKWWQGEQVFLKF